jgi:hypothetical protein
MSADIAGVCTPFGFREFRCEGTCVGARMVHSEFRSIDPSLARELCSWTEAIASWAGIPSIADDKKAVLYEPEAAEFIKLASEEPKLSSFPYLPPPLDPLWHYSKDRGH